MAVTPDGEREIMRYSDGAVIAGNAGRRKRIRRSLRTLSRLRGATPSDGAMNLIRREQLDQCS